MLHFCNCYSKAASYRTPRAPCSTTRRVARGLHTPYNLTCRYSPGFLTHFITSLCMVCSESTLSTAARAA